MSETKFPFVTPDYPLKDKEPVEFEAKDLGYPSNDLEACNSCGGTGHCWHRFTPGCGRELCVSCGGRGWVPRAFSKAFLGTPVTYQEYREIVDERLARERA